MLTKLKNNLPFLVLLVIASSLLFGKALTPSQDQIIYGEDIIDAYYYWKGYLKTSILSGTIPFWNPYNFSGTPFLNHPNINIFYPPNWIFILFPLNISFSLYFYFHFIIAGVTMYWLVRQYTSKFGASIASLLFILSGYFAARVYSGHLEYIDTASYLPLVFGLFRKAIIKFSKKAVLKAGIATFFMILSGNELFFLFVMELIGLYVLYHIFITRKNNKNRVKRIIKILQATIFPLIIGLSLASVGFLPRLEFMRNSIRSWGLSYETAGVGSFPFEGLKLFINPWMWGSPLRQSYSYFGPWPGHALFNHYMGVVPIILLVLFVVYILISKLLNIHKIPKIHSEIWFFLFMVIPFFLAISFGKNLTPNLHKILWQYTPVYKGIRLPARHLFMLTVSISVVTGIIVNSIKNKLIKFSLAAVILLDVFIYSKPFYQVTQLPTINDDKKLISILENDNDLFRVLPDYSVVSSVRKDFDFGAAMHYEVQTTSDYNSMVLKDYYRFIELLNKSETSMLPYYNVEIPPPSPWSSYIDFLNVKYVLTDKTMDQIYQKPSNKYELLEENTRYRLYKNSEYNSRFNFVANTKSFNSKSEMEEAIMSGIDLAETLLIYTRDSKKSNKNVQDCANSKFGEIDIPSYKPNYIMLNTKNNCDAWLSTSDVFYPGWKAKIDGKSTKIIQTNSAFRAIYVPKGDHTVEFYFFPTTFIIGGLISLSAFTTIFVLYRKSVVKNI